VAKLLAEIDLDQNSGNALGRVRSTLVFIETRNRWLLGRRERRGGLELNERQVLQHSPGMARKVVV